MELKIRETQVDDIEDMFSVRSRTRQNPISKERLAAYGITSESSAANMANGRVRGWACFHDSVLVGFCNGDGTTGEVLVLAVLPEFQGKGLGRLLLRTLSRAAVERGIRGFTATVLRENEAARALIGTLDPAAVAHPEDGVLRYEIALPWGWSPELANFSPALLGGEPDPTQANRAFGLVR